MNIEKWLDVEFESSSATTEEFVMFASNFKRYIYGQLIPQQSIVGWNRGHFYVSGFIKQGDRFVYFCTSDVRHFPNDWYYRILVRTAESEKDYTGGPNCYCKLPDFDRAISSLFHVGRNS